jgi:hypothetical protein
MSNIIQSFLVLGLIIILQLIIYVVFLTPIINTWGATKEEAKMTLIGDELAPTIVSTRAITIDVPIAQVWQWIIQLGADRGGFFSYTFIEKALGYESRENGTVPEFQNMEVGRIIPTSLDESKSLIKYHFPVRAVNPGESFVVENWGAFVLKKIDAHQTRLIVRTHGQELTTLTSKVESLLGMAAHYIMERRMLIGFKAHTEAGAGVHLSSTTDNFWLLGLFLSAIGITALIFLNGSMVSFVLAAIYSLIWLLTLLIFSPKPVFSASLLLIIVLTLVWI